MTSISSICSNWQREVVTLRFEGGLGFPEIARIQNAPINTVQGRYRYGMEKLRTLLNGEVESQSGRRDRKKEIQTMILISQDLGKKTTILKTDPDSGRSTLREVYILPQQGTVLEVMPVEKKYSRTELNETPLQELQQEVNSDPGDLLKEVLDCAYVTLGQSTVDGITVEGFQTTDPKFLHGTPGTVEVKIWVDVRTSLPVREESNIEVDLPDGSKAGVRSVAHGFQWDIPIDAAEFNPILPDDYTDLMGGTVNGATLAELEKTLPK